MPLSTHRQLLTRFLIVPLMLCIGLVAFGPTTVCADSHIVGEAPPEALEVETDRPGPVSIPLPQSVLEAGQPAPVGSHALSAKVAATANEFPSDEVEPGTSVIHYLAGMDQADRDNAQIDFEAGAVATGADAETLRSIAQTWNLGHHDEALAAMDSYGSAAKPALVVGVTWRSPKPTSAIKMNGTQVGSMGLNQDFVIESHWATGNVYAVTRDVEGGSNHFRVFRSTDNGATWSETFLWTNGYALVDFDAVAQGDHLYVTYVYGGAPTQARVRRFHADTGSYDSPFGIPTVIDDTEELVDVEIASTQDTADNQLYLLGLLPDGGIRYFFASTGASSWTEIATGVTNAQHTMNAQFNPESASNYFLFVSYVGTDGNVWVYRRGGSTGNALFDAGIDYFDYGAPLAAYGDIILIPYIKSGTQRFGVHYAISYNAGDSWLPGIIEYADSAGEHCYSPAATARGGSGFVVAYQMDEPVDDHLYARYRGYLTGWRDRYQVTENDLTWGLGSAIERMPSGGYGALTLTGGTSLFIEFDQSPFLFFDGMDLENTDAWSDTTP